MSDLDHVLRPTLPWRADAISECGRPNPDHAISREQFIQRLGEQGQKRSAMTTCMTCWDTARRWPTWHDDPVGRLAREFNGPRGARTSRDSEQLRDELRALAALVDAHRDEFDSYLAGLADTSNLAQHRAKRRATT